MTFVVPSPIGHALAGTVTAWLASPQDASTRFDPLSRLTAMCAALAALPDIDLLYPPVHRTFTHSVGATVLVTIIAAAVTGRVTARGTWRIALVCGAAYGSHVLLDWFGRDPNPPHGIQALWPFSTRWYIAPWTIFPGTERRQLISVAALMVNARALLVEVLVLGPLVVLAGVWRLRTATRRDQGLGIRDQRRGIS